jgi:hypothetical protein
VIDDSVLVRSAEYASLPTFDPSTLPTPTGTTVAQAQQTANSAYGIFALSISQMEQVAAVRASMSRAGPTGFTVRGGIGLAAVWALLASCTSEQPPMDPAVRAIYDECDALALRPAASEFSLAQAVSRDERRQQCMIARGVAPR